MKYLSVILFALFAFTVNGTGGFASEDKHDDHDGHDHAKHEKKEEHGKTGPRGGNLLEVGEHVAHIEFIHDNKTGTVTLYVYGPDAKTARKLEMAPRLNLMLKSGKKQIKTKAQGNALPSAAFEATDEVLKHEVEGVIALKIKGVSYKVELSHEGHDHH